MVGRKCVRPRESSSDLDYRHTVVPGILSRYILQGGGVPRRNYIDSTESWLEIDCREMSVSAKKQ
jgi:hypothetical protein